MKMHLTTCFRFNLFFFVIFPLIQVFPLHASPFLSDTSKALEARLVQSMGAEEDVVTPSLEAIHGYLQTHPEGYDGLRQALTPVHGPLAVRWQGYQPEVFLQRIQVLRQEAYDDFITDSDASPSHPFLGQLQGFMALFDPMGHLPFFQETCQKLGDFYRGYLDILCALPARDRMDFLKTRAMVFTESGTAYRLNQKTARALVSRSAHGFPLRSNASGNHLVVGHEGFHYKADDGRAPLTPSFEFLFSLADQLWRRPNRPLASSSAFLHFHQIKINQLAFDADFTNWYHERPRDDEDFAGYLQNHPGYQPQGTETVQSYAIQASETIQGESVETYLDQHPVLDPSAFDGDHFGMQVVLSLLLRPYDAKADNFLLIDAPTGKRFVGIDNDCLLTPQVYQFQDYHCPGVRNILYTLAPLMKEPFSKDFKQHIQSLSSTLPWTFLVGLFEKRKVYDGFAEHIGLSEEARQTYELAFHLHHGDFVNILKTWQSIQNAVVQPQVTTLEGLFYVVDPLTFSIYQALIGLYEANSQRVMEALYQEAEGTRLENLREYLSPESQKLFDQGNWPRRDKRREGRTLSLEESFLEAWQSPMVRDFSLEDIISFSQELVRLKSILGEAAWKPFLSNIKDSWPQKGLLANRNLPWNILENISPGLSDLKRDIMLQQNPGELSQNQTLRNDVSIKRFRHRAPPAPRPQLTFDPSAPLDVHGDLNASFIEAYLTKNPWLQIPSKNQAFLIKKMLGKSFRTLPLAGCQNITMKDFKALGLLALTVLDVSGCPFVDDETLTHLSQNCPNLLDLDVSRTAITGIGEKVSGPSGSYKPFQGPRLKKLRARDCLALCNVEKFHLQAPNLIYLDVPTLGFDAFSPEKVLDFSHGHFNSAPFSLLRKYPRIVSQLNVQNNNIGNEGCRSLSPFTSLSQLNIGRSRVGAEGCRYLSDLAVLTHLTMVENTMGNLGCQHLAQLKGLTYLNVSMNSINAQGCQHLAHLTGLTHLNVSGNTIKGPGLQHLLTLTGLTQLNLSDTWIRDTDCQHLLKFKNLTQLSVGRCCIGPLGCQYISQLQSLTHLDLWTNNIGSKGCQLLSQLIGLTQLGLKKNGLGALECKHLSQINTLTRLNLEENNIGDGGCQHLSNLQALTRLDLRNNNINAKGCQHLAQLKNLTFLGIGGKGNHLTPGAKDQLHRALPNCEIKF